MKNNPLKITKEILLETFTHHVDWNSTATSQKCRAPTSNQKIFTKIKQNFTISYQQ